jgi:hypothetical protein
MLCGEPHDRAHGGGDDRVGPLWPTRSDAGLLSHPVPPALMCVCLAQRQMEWDAMIEAKTRNQFYDRRSYAQVTIKRRLQSLDPTELRNKGSWDDASLGLRRHHEKHSV